ncbi:methylation-associated defense system protein kinase MAD6 [Haloactinomyces albus]|uniref:non-specific serine/threonine protein kinase n=1 Tax=Haloactinomyces albus TaxID=1352928 RepID=A0AAE3ZEM1_9ACTN|nr:protein kinase [Haloactinomyces albus]MDR7303497.1 serine/threonine protein kinase [Haloactinomyces albus]
MAEILGGGPPVNDDERAVLARLRDHGPEHWLVLHNIEIPARNETFEVDLVVVTDRAVFVADVKGTRGRIEVAGSKWLPSRRQPFHSPVAKLRGHARRLKGLLENHRTELTRAYTAPLVVLTGRDAELVDPQQRDADNVTTFDEFIAYMDTGFEIPSRFADGVAELGQAIVEALHGAVRRPQGPPKIGGWEIVERLGGNSEVTEYRARNLDAPEGAGTVLLRVYRADPFLPEAELSAQQRRLGNAYVALSRMPPHPNIVTARHFTSVEDGARFVLELDDTHGRPLLRCLNEPELALGTDTKLRVIRDVFAGLAHAHYNKVIHRALSPSTVVIADDGRSLLTGFDHARLGPPRTETVVDQIPEVVDPNYRAPECHRDLQAHSPASDVYAAGILAYQLLTGELPFGSSTEQYSQASVLPPTPLAEAGVDAKLTELFTAMCAQQPDERPRAADALREFTRIVGAGKRNRRSMPKQVENTGSSGTTRSKDFLLNLPEGHELTRKFTIRRKLGKGHFGAAYHVFDMIADTDWVLKLILRDRDSVIERMKHEYQVLVNLERHPNVVRVADANFLPDNETPYLQFEYVDGRDLGSLTSGEQPLGPADVLRFGIEAARGIAHLHRHGVYHCDIKPSNLLWTEQGCKIIDFNVAVTSDSTLRHGGGSTRYLPPDLDISAQPSAADLADRDTYALALSLYEALTGAYPWDTGHPPPGEEPAHPAVWSGVPPLAPAFVEALLKAIAPQRSQRYGSVSEFLDALSGITTVWVEPPERQLPEPGESARESTNAFVDYLRTLYSQSTSTNQGTRGKDPTRSDLYVTSALDDRLLPDVLAGHYRLVIITGNAGDGKTAFLEHLLERARDEQASFSTARENGASFTLGGMEFHTNHDGSQDEGERANNAVLAEFFGPFSGEPTGWPDDQSRVIAINEGRLVDFLTEHAGDFTELGKLVNAGLAGHRLDSGVAVVNLNNRSVLADPEGTGSIFSRMLDRMTRPEFWQDCASCEISTHCYALHNARTFADPTAGQRTIERLRSLYQLAHLRGRLHITLRDLRSALAYTLTSGRSCAQIKSLYERGRGQEILDAYYFNSWIGPEGGHDRLLAELRELDVAEVPAPSLERRFDYAGPDTGSATMSFDQRSGYDLELLSARFEQLPRGSAPDLTAHRDYIAAAKRRFFFESLEDIRSASLLPYQSARMFLDVLASPNSVGEHLGEIIDAINRGEGLTTPDALGDAVALRVRHVPNGTISSYRLFDKDKFTLHTAGAPESRYLEGEHDHLLLRYVDPGGQQAGLAIKIDLYELLYLLRRGHVPNTSDSQGRYLSLTMFKNALSAVPYQEVLLTNTGRDLHRVRREPGGRLVMEALSEVR